MWPFNRGESRSIENPDVPITNARLAEILMAGMPSAAEIIVNEDSAMTVPAYFGGVNFLAATLAGFPLKTYDKTSEGRKPVTNRPAQILHGAVNPEMSSFDWRKYMFECALTGGRGLTYIEKNTSGQLQNLWPLDPKKTVISRKDGRKQYIYEENGRKTTYSAEEIIDIPFMLKSDGISHRGPVNTGRDVLGLAIAATKYGSKFFAGGGVPPFALLGGFQSSESLKAAAADMEKSVRNAAKKNRLALTLPAGLEIKNLGVDPEKSQLVDLQRFLIEEIARLLSLPPVFLQDLTHGTFSNTEQQDLHLVKHTLRRWAEQFEQELNLKLFGRFKNKRYVELNMDGLLRGDFITRMNGYSQAIQTGHLMPSEAREQENRPYVEGSDRLFIQGATVPLQNAGEAQNTPPEADDVSANE